MKVSWQQVLSYFVVLSLGWSDNESLQLNLHFELRKEVSMATRQAGTTPLAAANRHRYTETSPVEIIT